MRSLCMEAGTLYRFACMKRFSLPVSRSSTLGSWNTMPMDLRTLPDSLTMSCPSTVAEPEVGLSMVHSMETVVVFPAPLGPSRPKISPLSTLMFRLSTALKVLYALVSWRVFMTGGIEGRFCIEDV